MNLGPFKVGIWNHGTLRLDGGAMFGAVPKALWAGMCPPDEENRILLATRSLVIEVADRVFVVDLGSGDKWTERFRELYDFRPDPSPGPERVTDIVVTHLHFDHAAGLSKLVDGRAQLAYPEATVYLQAANLGMARRPNIRERASYLKEEIAVLDHARVELADGSKEIYPGIWVHRSDGHTRGLQWVAVRGGDQTVAYPSDLIPTSKHLPLPYHMGYDMNVEALLVEKERFLAQAHEERWIVVFEHDPDFPAVRVSRDERGRFGVAEVVGL